MPVKYKIDVLSALKAAGYTTYRLQKEKIFGSSTIQKLRKGEVVSTQHLGTLCKILQCQPGDLLEYAPEEK